MSVKDLNREKCYRAVWNGRKGLLTYLYVNENTWTFCDGTQDPNNVGNYKPVSAEDVSGMKINKSI